MQFLPSNVTESWYAGPARSLSTHGSSIHESVLGVAETKRLAEVLTPLASGSGKAGARHLASHPAVAAIAHDPRLLELARAALGGEALPYRATLFTKTREANWLVVWHQDTALPLRRRFDAPGWEPWSVKLGIAYAHAPTWALQQIVALRLHLDDSTEENGPLRVIPGSHRLGVLADAEVGRVVKSATPATHTVAKGGVLAMSPLLLHSSSKSLVPAARRVLHIEYAVSFALAPGIELAVA